jgi:hypothetical protein
MEHQRVAGLATGFGQTVAPMLESLRRRPAGLGLPPRESADDNE